jgi:hypothetical protein
MQIMVMGVRCASELRSDFGTERTCVGAPALTRHVPLLTFPFLFLTVGRRSQRLDERTRIKFASVPQSPAGFTTLHGSCGCGNLQVRRGQRVLSQVVCLAYPRNPRLDRTYQYRNAARQSKAHSTSVAPRSRGLPTKVFLLHQDSSSEGSERYLTV